MKVSDPTGQTWRVTRRWVPWRRRLKGAIGSVPDVVPSGLGSDPISAVIFVVCLIIAIPFLLLALLASIELLALLLVFPVALAGRVLFGRHWTIEVRRGFRPHWEERSGDWSTSGRRIAEVAEAIERGAVPPTSWPADGQERVPEEQG